MLGGGGRLVELCLLLSRFFRFGRLRVAVFVTGMKSSCWLVCRTAGVLAIVALIFVLGGCSRHTPVVVPSDGQVQVPGAPAEESLLSDEARKFLWDVEHLGFVLEQTVFPKWNAVISGGESADVSSWFSREFVGQVPAEGLRLDSMIDRAVVRYEFSGGPVSVEGGSAEVDSGALATVSADEFVRWFRKISHSDSRSDFSAVENAAESDAKVTSASLGLVRLFPVERASFDGAWNSIWKFRITTGTDGALGEFVGRVEFSLGSLHDDIAEDKGWIRSARILKCQRVVSETPLMAETTAESGIDVEILHDHWREGSTFVPNTGGVYLSDYNDDGHLDVLVDDQQAGVFLYRGSGDGTFTDQTVAAGITSLKQGEPLLWALSTWGDFDNDGDDDLITEAHIYQNNGDGTFKEVTEHCNLRLTPAAGYAIGDYDGDGLADLYVCHSGAWHRGDEQPGKVKWIDGGLGVDNVLWRNTGDWQFEDVTHRLQAGADGSSSFSAVWLHANADGRPDLFAINEFGRNSLLLNQADSAWLTSDVDPVFGGFSMGVTAGDFDNDGHDDVYVSNMYSKAGNRILANVDTASYPVELYQKIVEATTGNKLYCGIGDGRFRTVPDDLVVPDIGWAYGAEFVDLNLDGWLDMYVTAGFKSETRGKPDG